VDNFMTALILQHFFFLNSEPRQSPAFVPVESSQNCG